MKKTHDAFYDYWIRMTAASNQHRAAVIAIAHLQDNPASAKNFTDHLRIDYAKALVPDPAAAVTFSPESIPRMIDARITDVVSALTQLPLRLRQNTLILYFALFESFTAGLHRQVLSHHPSLLKHDRKIDLGRLIDSGYDGVIAEEVERAVRALDRESIPKRAAYFRERLKLSWLEDADEQNDVNYSSNLRNWILHDDPEKDVTDNELDKCAMAMISAASAFHRSLIATYPEVSQQR